MIEVSRDHPVDDRPWAWADAHMPLLHRTATECGESLRGLTIGVCLHLEPKTAALVETLLLTGAHVVATGSPGTTHPESVEALRSRGAEVLAGPEDSLAEHDHQVAEIVARRPDLLLDNGGDLILHAAHTGVSVLGATEETTTGGIRLRDAPTPLAAPVIVINDSPLKRLVENEYGVGQTVVQGFMNATNLMLPGLAATVIGYGPCGRGVAATLATLGARVTVVEPNPYRALEALMAGHRVDAVEQALVGAKAVFLVSGVRNSVPPNTYPLLEDGTVLVGVSHFPHDLDLTALRHRAVGARRIGTRLAELEILDLDGRQVTVVNQLHMVNLSAALGNPIEAMDLGLSLQLRSLAWLAEGRAHWCGPEAPPEAVDRVVAHEMVELLIRRGRA